MDKKCVNFLLFIWIGLISSRSSNAENCPEGWTPIESTLPNHRKAPGNQLRKKVNSVVFL